MITNKDIRVENGSLILNGDPYPLDGQSPEAIMQIVEDNSDTTPTDESKKPVTSDGIYTALAHKAKKLPAQTTRYNFTAANTYENTGVNVTCPAGHTYIVRAILSYSNSEPKGIAASWQSATMRMYDLLALSENTNTVTFILAANETAYIWAKGAQQLGDDIEIDILDIAD